MNAQADSLATKAYPPLNDVRKALRVKWYRSPISNERLKALSERSDKQGWLQAGGHIGLFLFTGALTIMFWSAGIWWAFFVALWCHGFVGTFFKGTAAHELGHGTVFKSRKLNRAFLYSICMISWWDPFDYGASHTYHHRYTTHVKADRENVLPLTPSLHPWVLLQMFTINLFGKPSRNFNKGGFFWNVYLTARTAFGSPTPHTDIPSQEWLHSLHQSHPEEFKRSITWCRVLMVFHSTVLIIAIATGWWVLPLVISLPSFIASCGSYFLGTTQHCGLPVNVTDFRKNTRSLKLNPFMSFLYWRMNWHTEHHMYAGVPCYNLKALAAELKDDMPEPRTVLQAWREMRETFKRQQKDPSYNFDTPVPNNEVAERGNTASSEADLVASIGDLAPEELS